MPEGMRVTYSQDKSVFVNQLLGDLQNHVMIAVILVFIVILYALSGRASLLIGLAIPSSFLIGILLLAMAGLHDQHDRAVQPDPGGRHAGRRRHHRHRIRRAAHDRGHADKQDAFALAAKRMAGPVIAATMTRIAAFSPLLFWPGIVGDFMKYMPITLIVTLSASMLYALVFTPTLGAIFAKAPSTTRSNRDGWYMAIVKQAVRFPDHRAGADRRAAGRRALGLCANTAPASSSFPMSSPITACSTCMPAAISRSTKWTRRPTRPRSACSAGPASSRSIPASASRDGGGQDVAEDVVGVIQYEFVDWRERKSANHDPRRLRGVMAGIPGVDVEVRVPEAGPPTGKAIQVRLSAADPTGLDEKARTVAATLAKVPGVIDVSDGLPPPGVDWALEVDRAKAAQYGISPTSVGTVVQLVTNGLKLSEYRPAGADDAVDIRLRLPEDRRTLSTLDELGCETTQGSVPISNFVSAQAGAHGRHPQPHRRRAHHRRSGQRRRRRPGRRPCSRQSPQAIDKMNLGTASAGSSPARTRKRRRRSAFLGKAFGAAIFLIFLVLLAQFNKFTSVCLVLSCVVMSTIGVFLGLLIMGQPFGIVMSGIGVIALGRRGGEQQHRADRHL